MIEIILTSVGVAEAASDAAIVVVVVVVAALTGPRAGDDFVEIKTAHYFDVMRSWWNNGLRAVFWILDEENQ